MAEGLAEKQRFGGRRYGRRGSGRGSREQGSAPLNYYSQDEALNYDDILALEYMMHQDHGVDDVRVFQDVRRPREGGAYNCTIVWGDDIFWFYPTSITDEYSKFAKELNETEEWNPQTVSGVTLNYQGQREILEKAGKTFDDVERGLHENIDIDESLSYQNDKGWLAPTEDFYAMTGLIHHYGADRDVESTRFESAEIGDFDAKDVIEFRDEVNDSKQQYQHQLGDDERIKMHATYEDGDYNLEAEVTDDWEIDRAFFVKP